jgi:4-amino-4-deoxy-L-arabinose transferase-like glycosyltransferase
MDQVPENGPPARLWRGNVVAVAAALAAGMALRVWWILHYGQTTNDTRVYGEFARNLLEHHVYGWTNIVKGVLRPPQGTLIRLPGYPLFLAACFKLFGMENYTAVMLVQAAADLWTCLLLGGVAARIFGRRAGLAALWMAALCPFTANYVAAPLTETLTLWCMGLAFYGVVRWREGAGGPKIAVNRWVYVIGFALAYAILLRPEQGLLAAAVVPAMLWMGRKPALRAVILVCVLTVLPLVPWTVRNWRVFHVFQPLAPRFATDPGDRINYGFQRWFRTWGIEFMSTETVYWNYDGAPISIADLPDRAFDSNAQYAETEAVLSTYNLTDNGSYALDARFAAIAAERVRVDPVRYYLALPVARVLDMMFRPRTEMLPVPLEWWKFNERRGADAFALAYAGLNLGFFVLAATAFRRGESWHEQEPVVWMMVATILLRTMVLLTLDNSEDRYTLEFYPVLIVLGAAAFRKRA